VRVQTRVVHISSGAASRDYVVLCPRNDSIIFGHVNGFSYLHVIAYFDNYSGTDCISLNS